MRNSSLETFLGRSGIVALRRIRASVSLRRSRGFVVGPVSSVDRDLVFQDRNLVSGWRFAPADRLNGNFTPLS